VSDVERGIQMEWVVRIVCGVLLLLFIRLLLEDE